MEAMEYGEDIDVEIDFGFAVIYFSGDSDETKDFSILLRTAMGRPS